MTNRPTFIDYISPQSERSVYFDAPIMHIFSKKDSGDAGFIAPSPKRDSRIHSTTSLKSLRDNNEDAAQPAAQGAVSGQPVDETQAPEGDREYEEPGQHEEPQSTLRSTDYAANGTMVSNSATRKMDSARKPREGSTSTDLMSDSGYDSAGSPRNQPRSLRNSAEMQPIPVVWAEGAEPAPEHDEEQPQPRSKSAFSAVDPKRSQSMRSFRSGQESLRTTASGRRTPRRRVSITGGSFASGAGTVGPASQPQDDETQLFRSRSVSAEASLTKKQKLKIGKNELKEAKMVAKIIKKEAKVEKEVLEQAVRELGELQRTQKYAVKEEAKASASYSQALRVFHKEELAFLAARAKFERAQADLQAHEEAREAAREHARESTEILQEKNREIEWLRAQKAADDRERELKLRELAGKA